MFSLTYFANLFFRRIRIVNFEEQILMAYGGLRGAIAFSLVQLLDKQEQNKIGIDNMIIKNTRLFQTTTLFVIMFTVIVLVCLNPAKIKSISLLIECISKFS